jgi:hypothetical protein
VLLITDSRCAPALHAAAELMGFPGKHVRVYPDADEMNDWREHSFIQSFGNWLTHLIAIERVGPGHTEESLWNQWREEAMLQKFLEQVPKERRGHCHNMRGEIITAWTGGLHRLFEWVREYRPEVKTIGIGDGGNEIGMGAIRWDEVSKRLLGENAARIPCRIATDWNLIAGTSNWGGYALAAGVLSLRERLDVMEPWTCDEEQDMLKQFVREGPAVDGATRLPQATVDGLPFLTYIQSWAGIRRRLGLAE